MIDIIQINLLRDGGTSVWVSTEDIKGIDMNDMISIWNIIKSDCNKYHIDYRIGSKTKGELFDRYPSDEGAQILDKSQFNFVTKEQILRDNKINNIVK
jgi:hypothetical protein